MYSLEKIEQEIHELENAPMCSSNVKLLAALMTIKHRLENKEHHKTGDEDHKYTKLSMEDARAWVSKMKNADGSRGPLWSVEQIRSVQDMYGIRCDTAELYAIMNSLYSDFGEVLETAGIGSNDTKFYAELAKAWLRDADALPNKAMRYYKNVVQK